MNAKAFMRQAQKYDRLIENKMAEVAHWRALALSTTAASAPETGVRVQTSGSQQRMAEAIEKLVDMEREINADIDRLVDCKREIIEVIEQLNATEYDVLHKLYIQGMLLDQVATAKDKTYSWVTTVHGRALKNVQRILDAQKVCD